MVNTKNKVYYYLLYASLLASFADSLFGPLYAVFVQNIGGGILDVGNTIALYSITTGILIIAAGKISDSVSKELLAFIGFGISALGTIGYLFIETSTQLYLLQLIFALSTALLTAPLSALFAKHIGKENSGFLWALQGGGEKILAGLGLLGGTFITYRFGFVAVFVCISIIQVAATLFQALVYVDSRKS